jgi:hypothetical protein
MRELSWNIIRIDNPPIQFLQLGWWSQQAPLAANRLFVRCGRLAADKDLFHAVPLFNFCTEGDDQPDLLLG